MKINVGLVDDHHLVLKSLGIMIDNFKDFEVTLEAKSGQELQKKINSAKVKPDIMLIDVNMPVMDGIAVATWFRENYPVIKLVALSMNEDERVIIKMIKAGCCTYFVKSVSPFKLEKALVSIYKTGYYNGDLNIAKLLKKHGEEIVFTNKELLFIELSCSENTYQKIAEEMFLSFTRIDDLRKSVFEKLEVKTRTGMVIEAIRKEIVKL